MKKKIYLVALIILNSLFFNLCIAEGKISSLTSSEQKFLNIRTWEFNYEEGKKYTVTIGFRDSNKVYHQLLNSVDASASFKIALQKIKKNEVKVYSIHKNTSHSSVSTFELGNASEFHSKPELENGIYKLMSYKKKNSLDSYFYVAIKQNL